MLTVRMHSGISGDMFLAGLLHLTQTGEEELDSLLEGLLPELKGTVRLTRRLVHGIGGWYAEVNLPHRHEHRTLSDVTAIIDASTLAPRAKELALDTFRRIALAEGEVHGKSPEEVHFHEVGALDSILDICLACELFVRLAPDLLVASPLPVNDGEIVCAHGVIPVPAPAVLALMENVPVRPFAGVGETVTPTGLALLKSLGAVFGPWPPMVVEKRALVYGTRVFENAANGTVFALGSLCPAGI